MLTITEIKELMREHGLRANKRLGQNFLIDKNIANKIINCAAVSGEDVVLEIGAGLGNITAEIASVAKKVIAVEFDKGFFGVLKKRMAGCKNCEFALEDILKFDFRAWSKGGALKIIGNIPYYITTPLFERFIQNRDCIKEAFLMVQKELGQRLTAAEGGRLYGSISCYVRFYAELKQNFIVKRDCFFPRPDVDSVFLSVRMRDIPAVRVADENLLFNIVR
ncbi:MAG: ribosomal RNA small subunit methyltransferase A, partial [Candidatus Omnitrophica bacterium]|nr:ribosomal RNA small subunit methyltransferase A [Candidatus Omnitrophota bacterium]